MENSNPNLCMDLHQFYLKRLEIGLEILRAKEKDLQFLAVSPCYFWWAVQGSNL